MKLTTQRLKKLIKEELEGLEEAPDKMAYVICENHWGDITPKFVYMSKEAASVKVEELNIESEKANDEDIGSMGTFYIEDVQLMD